MGVGVWLSAWERIRGFLKVLYCQFNGSESSKRVRDNLNGTSKTNEAALAQGTDMEQRVNCATGTELDSKRVDSTARS